MTNSTAPFHHIFCCMNQRPDGHPRGCCQSRGSAGLHAYFKERVKALGLKGVRAGKALCFDRCEDGPVMVIYPQGVWYRYTSKADVDAIINEYLLGGKIVARLQLRAPEGLSAPDDL